MIGYIRCVSSFETVYLCTPGVNSMLPVWYSILKLARNEECLFVVFSNLKIIDISKIYII